MPVNEAMVFPVVMYGWLWELDHKESWVPKSRCFWTVVLEKSLESPLHCKIKPVHPKGNQSWTFIGRTDAEAEAPIVLPPNSKGRLTGKDPDAGKDWRQEKKGMTKEEMVEWHHQLSRHEFEQALGDDEGQGRLAGCSPWSHEESDTTEPLNNNNGWRVTVSTISPLFPTSDPMNSDWFRKFFSLSPTFQMIKLFNVDLF